MWMQLVWHVCGMGIRFHSSFFLEIGQTIWQRSCCVSIPGNVKMLTLDVTCGMGIRFQSSFFLRKFGRGLAVLVYQEM